MWSGAFGAAIHAYEAASNDSVHPDRCVDACRLTVEVQIDS
jgi:hypothetical protein